MGRFTRIIWLGAGLVCAAALVALTVDELQTSRLQSAVSVAVVRGATFSVVPGTSDSIRFPVDGPHDERLGYRRLPEQIARLQARGWVVASQARWSPRAAQLHDHGLFVPYREKSRAGLSLSDCRAEPLLQSRVPQRVYERFETVPPLLVDTLLFIEDRHLLDADQARRNPAIDPERLAKALLEQAHHAVDQTHSAAGGSTLATQIEKYRHSPHGRTDSAGEKLRQMVSASLRGYLDGEDNLARRRQIVVDYLNSVPLAARPGFGELHGLGDGLWAWYGRDFDELNRLLADGGEGLASNGELPRPPGPGLARPAPRGGSSKVAEPHLLEKRQALAFKQALSLMIAQRRPSQLLLGDGASLPRLTDSYLRLLADAGVITAELRDAALRAPLRLRAEAPQDQRPDYVQRKAVSATRAGLSALLGVPRAYDLERLDLDVETALDGTSQELATRWLKGLKTRAAARAAGLYGTHLLSDGADPSELVFSFTLFERGAHANLLRIQADSIDQPFDVNEGARLDLGSTAKLRTLITYLEIVAELHARWAALPSGELAALAPSGSDPLAVWARQHLLRAGDRSLGAMLEAALDRSYSANPAEAFFTGGGLHRFQNFDPDHNRRSMTVREAFRHSVNLVFIRLMRDIVRHRNGGDAADSRRRELLAQFADREGSIFLQRFHAKYRGRSADEARSLLLRAVPASAAALASALVTIDPQADDARLEALLNGRLGRGAGSPRELRTLRETAARLSLADRGYLARVHPLELWLVGYLRRQPGATLGDALDASRDERQQVYDWLFKTRHKVAQDRRIRTSLEVDAFARIQRSWRRLGYPFDSLTPSYASAIGASGDRPAALAELMGIIANGGARLPIQRIDALHFARATPYETRLEPRNAAGEQVLDPAIAELVRRVLVDVVEQGTARRLRGTLTDPAGRGIEVGGKTGTGDHRFKVTGAGAQVISDRVIARSATFVFTIGDRYFGTVMAYVPGSAAARYRFTSALPVQLLKSHAAQLLASLAGSGCGADTALREGRP